MRQIIFSIMAAAVSALLISCEEHVPLREFREMSVETGSILCSDGTAVPYGAYTPEMNGVGVIVKSGTAEDDYRFIAIGKEDIGTYAYAEACNTEWYVDSGAGTDRTAFDGKENTAAMIAAAYDKVEEETVTDSDGNRHTITKVEYLHYPAAEAARDYMASTMQGWHLPSAGEWLAVFSRMETIQRSLELIGGHWVDTSAWYQSSSQDGASAETRLYYNLSVSSSGMAKGNLKTEKAPVRPFITIK